MKERGTQKKGALSSGLTMYVYTVFKLNYCRDLQDKILFIGIFKPIAEFTINHPD
jgi:hypothetical protein